MLNAHAEYAPSGAEGWFNCPGWAASKGTNDYADEGTAAHEVLTLTLRGEALPAKAANGWAVDDEMIEHATRTAEVVQGMVQGGTLYVDSKVSIGHITGEFGATGTLDVAIIRNVNGRTELIVIDYKYGRGIAVGAERNLQMMLYALGALHDFDQVGLVDDVTLMICQPRNGGWSEWTAPMLELKAFGAAAFDAAQLHRTVKAGEFSALAPTEDSCRWCAKKATCPAVINTVESLIEAEFEVLATEKPAALAVEQDPDGLALCMKSIGLVEDWCKAVRAEVERRLLAGDTVEGFKLVEGRKGPRAWSDVEDAEKALKAFRLKKDQMYDLKLISPTTAEKRAKEAVIRPGQWTKLQALITQSGGGPSVAPVSDKRPPIVIKPVEDAFEVLAESPTAAAAV